MQGTKETREVLAAVAGIIKDVDRARSDDRKISLAEAVGIVTTNAAAVITAIRGAGTILEEAKDFTKEELDGLYEYFLTEMEWEPTDANRDFAAAYFDLIRDVYTNILRIINTHRPPRAIPV